MKIRNSKGFTLIELLIVVAIIGIIAAIAIPNLLNAIDRGKQKRTMADMRSIGTAVESYAIDSNIYPVGGTLAAVASDLALTVRYGRSPGAETGRPLGHVEGLFWRIDDDYLKSLNGK